MKKRFLYLFFLLLSYINIAQEIDPNDDLYQWVPLDVKASAYNSIQNQTNRNPSIGAWGDTLVPGMKAVAISRDLMKLGITKNTPIKIEGYDGIYLVKDKMNARYHKKIDIYMGLKLQKAKNFGIQHLKIWYGIPK
ncbi:3D domain-containing protein [Joostella atrarenae]|uniref:3D domain-containing protein n=1 Tax=Joostella atrarenae TaxID=679257 RepID=A0ABS9J517_9FLAO|nr:3D domain-containing protein [Joostella atrarenae]MCF8715489.1 3D domain-containing protein [Joostella atrarenae]